MTRWDGIDEFREVVENGSFTGAAQKLGVSKSYISKQMKALEERFGARLVNRTTRQMTLTEAGEIFFQQCKKMTAQFDDTESLISQLQNAPLGNLKIGLNGTYGVRYMATAIAAFSNLHPQLNLEVTSETRDVDLTAEGYDMAIRYGELEDSSHLRARRLGSHNLYLCATPDYLEKHGKPRGIKELKSHNCLSGPSRQWYFSSQGGTIKLKVEGNWNCEDGATLMAGVLGGVGIGQLPDFYIQKEVEAGRLVIIQDQWAQFNRVAWAIYPHSRHLSAKVRLLIKFLSEYIDDQLKPKKPEFIQQMEPETFSVAHYQ
ncbi:MAG: LysR family transcriptional regulator [Zetaproteobacteria bacterium]|nr:LysR family transcriptional regulator [Pseudobdellovibrionaceae bacterium]